MLGATGSIGRATVQALVADGHDVVCFVRRGSEKKVKNDGAFNGVTVRIGDVTDTASVADNGFCNETFDAVVSCMASRTGAAADAWQIDHAAHVTVLNAAKNAGVLQFVLLSAICVQKPLLAFQHAKLAFEQALAASSLTYSIVRPTAFFKSLSGQIDRLRTGKSFLLFGDGTLTACKPISDRDLATFMVDCLNDETRHNKILPVGGPGPAITPLEQGQHLFKLMNKPPRFKQVPVAFFDVIIATLSTLGVLIPPLRAKAELARIGRYYATESMLVWNPKTDEYDADATPSTGTDTLFDFYADMVAGTATVDRGDHKVF